ncbi:MAG: C39 family peptidase [Anaerolineae bacterium]|jgi:hypothetical protein
MLKTRYAFPIAALGLAILTLLVLSLTAVAVIRALPGRYAYYLPGPLQNLRHNPSHPDTLPTPVVVQTPMPGQTPTSTPRPIATHVPVPVVMPTAPPATSTAPPMPSPTPTLPASFNLAGLRHEHQGWNNCGPATLTMLLSYWGCEQTQQDAAPVLKPDPEDKNVSPWEMEAYVRDLGFEVITRVNGDLHRLKTLLRAGFPVIVETWYVRDARDQLGHYRLIVGYDDEAREFLTYDSLHGPDVTIGYRELDELWRVFNRLYLVAYTADEWEALASILVPDLYDAGMYERALEVARGEAVALPTDCVAYADCADWVTFSWFNVGASLTALGRHAEAAPAYDKARQLGLHYRMLWYQFGPYQSYYEVGRYEDVVALANATLATANNLEESYYWRGMARLAQGNVEGARSDFNAALRYHEGWPLATSALANLNDS